MVLMLGLQAPWQRKSQYLDVEKNPHTLLLHVITDRGRQYPCLNVKKLYQIIDFTEKNVWNIRSPAKSSWTREHSNFTLLFEQAAYTLVKGVLVKADACIISITDKRLWRVVFCYVVKAHAQFDFSMVRVVVPYETTNK